jgi:hypothetical protein
MYTLYYFRTSTDVGSYITVHIRGQGQVCVHSPYNNSSGGRCVTFSSTPGDKRKKKEHILQVCKPASLPALSVRQFGKKLALVGIG